MPSRETLLAALRTPYALLTAAYFLLRLNAFAGVEPKRYRDTDTYLDVARESLFSLDFLAGARSWTVPLLYKVMPEGDKWLALGQFALSVGCWLALAGVVAWCVRPGAYRLVAFALILVFSMAFPIIQWDTVILTESVSISLTVAVVAAWLALVRAPGPPTVAAVLATTLFWVFARDTNAFLALITVPLVGLWLLRPGARASRVALLGGLCAIVALGFLSTTTENAQLRREERPMLHVVGERILPDTDKRDYFVDHGMPEPTPRVLANRHRLAGLGNGVASDPASDEFLEWVRDHGRSTLAGYLATHPYDTVRPVVGERARLVNVISGYRSGDSRTILPATIAEFIYPGTFQAVFFWLVVIGLGAALVTARARPQPVWIVPLVALALQIPHALVVWHGDTLEVPRHGLLVAVLLRLSLLLLALFAIDALLERLRPRPASTDVRLPAQERTPILSSRPG